MGCMMCDVPLKGYFQYTFVLIIYLMIPGTRNGKIEGIFIDRWLLWTALPSYSFGGGNWAFSSMWCSFRFGACRSIATQPSSQPLIWPTAPCDCVQRPGPGSYFGLTWLFWFHGEASAQIDRNAGVVLGNWKNLSSRSWDTSFVGWWKKVNSRHIGIPYLTTKPYQTWTSRKIPLPNWPMNRLGRI